MKKILKILLIIILILLIILIINFVHNYFIIKKIHNLGYNTISNNDSYHISYSNSFPSQTDSSAIIEYKISADIFYKNHTFSMKLYDNDELSTEYWYNTETNETLNKTTDAFRNVINPENMHNMIDDYIKLNLNDCNFLKYLTSIIISKNNYYEIITFPCFSIEKSYYNKNTGLLEKYNNSSNSFDGLNITYEFNNVSDQDIIKPNN